MSQNALSCVFSTLRPLRKSMPVRVSTVSNEVMESTQVARLP